MAYKEVGSSARNNRDSESKRLGVELFDGQTVKAGNILVRQCGTKFHTGYGVGPSKDHTLLAKVDGVVRFKTKDVFGREYMSIIAT